jgi:magnesium-transporting ATPase (P-type)
MTSVATTCFSGGRPTPAPASPCGYRVFAVAAADHGEASPASHGTWESGLSLLGLVGILDPSRDTSRTTIAACERAGIAPVLITGDHPLTARAVAARSGIVARADEVTTGDRIRTGTAGDLTALRLYARTTPEQKLDIVQAWRAAGHVVGEGRRRCQRRPRPVQGGHRRGHGPAWHRSGPPSG